MIAYWKFVCIIKVTVLLVRHSIAALTASNETSCPNILVASSTVSLVDGNLTSCISASSEITEASWVLAPRANSSFQVKVTVQGVDCSATNLEVFSDIGCIDPLSKQECPLTSSTPQSTPPNQHSCFYNCSCSLSCSRLYTRIYPQNGGTGAGLCEVALMT